MAFSSRYERVNSRTTVLDAEEFGGEILNFGGRRDCTGRTHHTRHTPPNFFLPQTLDAKKLVSFLRRSPTMGDKFLYPQTKVLNGGAGRA